MGGRGFAKSKWFGTVSEKWDWMWYRGEELPVWGYLCAVSIHLYHSSLRLHVILANGKRQQTALKTRSWYHAAGTMLHCLDDSKLCRDLRRRSLGHAFRVLPSLRLLALGSRDLPYVTGSGKGRQEGKNITPQWRQASSALTSGIGR